MLRRIFKTSSLFMVVVFSIFGCASVNYVGKSFDATTNIETYYSEDEIEKEYTVIGHAVGLGVLTPSHKVHAKLTKEAKNKGADAILITGIRKGEVLITTGMAAAENQIYASFIKYK